MDGEIGFKGVIVFQAVAEGKGSTHRDAWIFVVHIYQKPGLLILAVWQFAVQGVTIFRGRIARCSQSAVDQVRAIIQSKSLRVLRLVKDGFHCQFAVFVGQAPNLLPMERQHDQTQRRILKPHCADPGWISEK